jgi:hypothetical protein
LAKKKPQLKETPRNHQTNKFYYSKMKDLEENKAVAVIQSMRSSNDSAM